MHPTVTGKAILAAYPANESMQYSTLGACPHARIKRTERTELFAKLERIDERGYAIDDQDTLTGYGASG